MLLQIGHSAFIHVSPSIVGTSRQFQTRAGDTRILVLPYMPRCVHDPREMFGDEDHGWYMSAAHFQHAGCGCLVALALPFARHCSCHQQALSAAGLRKLPQPIEGFQLPADPAFLKPASQRCPISSPKAYSTACHWRGRCPRHQYGGGQTGNHHRMASIIEFRESC